MCATAGAGSAAGIFGVKPRPAKSLGERTSDLAAFYGHLRLKAATPTVVEVAPQSTLVPIRKEKQR